MDRAQLPMRIRFRCQVEASPYMMLQPLAPERAARDLAPSSRFIALFRDPVERALSHYWRNRKVGRETESFAVALKRKTSGCGALSTRSSAANPARRIGGTPIEPGASTRSSSSAGSRSSGANGYWWSKANASSATRRFLPTCSRGADCPRTTSRIRPSTPFRVKAKRRRTLRRNCERGSSRTTRRSSSCWGAVSGRTPPSTD